LCTQRRDVDVSRGTDDGNLSSTQALEVAPVTRFLHGIARGNELAGWGGPPAVVRRITPFG